MTISDPISSKISFVSGSATAGNYNATTGIWDYGTLSPSSCMSLNINFSIPAASAGYLVSNQASTVWQTDTVAIVTSNVAYFTVAGGTSPSGSYTLLNDTYTTQQDTPVVTLPFANDVSVPTSTTPSGTPGSQVLPLQGTLSYDYLNDQITYTPNPGWYGTDSFTYYVCSENNPFLCGNLSATVFIIVTNVYDLPIAYNDVSIGCIEGQNCTVFPFVNDIDPDNLTPDYPVTSASWCLVIDTLPLYGVLAQTSAPNPSVTYIPDTSIIVVWMQRSTTLKIAVTVPSIQTKQSSPLTSKLWLRIRLLMMTFAQPPLAGPRVFWKCCLTTRIWTVARSTTELWTPQVPQSRLQLLRFTVKPTWTLPDR